MTDIINAMKGKKHYIGMNGANDKAISEAEEALGVRFAKDYFQYVTQIGVASFDGHELTGICQSNRLDVVSVTRRERQKNPDIDEEWYVVEQTNMDDVTIWQNTDGEIYQTSPGSKPIKLCGSLLEYIDL